MSTVSLGSAIVTTVGSVACCFWSSVNTVIASLETSTGERLLLVSWKVNFKVGLLLMITCAVLSVTVKPLTVCSSIYKTQIKITLF